MDSHDLVPTLPNDALNSDHASWNSIENQGNTENLKNDDAYSILPSTRRKQRRVLKFASNPNQEPQNRQATAAK